MFKVKASLAINVNPFNLLNSALTYIETNSTYAYLFITLSDNSLGKFVSRTYHGVITSTNEKQD